MMFPCKQRPSIIIVVVAYNLTVLTLFIQKQQQHFKYGCNPVDAFPMVHQNHQQQHLERYRPKNRVRTNHGIVVSSSSSSSLNMLPSFQPNDILMASTAIDILHQSPLSHLSSSSMLLADLVTAETMSAVSSSSGSSYSQLSYFTILGLYIMSFPGLWSIITRSTSAKMKRKTYISPGVNYSNSTSISTLSSSSTAATDDAVVPILMNKPPLSLREQAGEIMAYMKANNYNVTETTSTTVTFQGIVQRSLSQAFFLTFCTALGLLSLALVLQIQFQSMNLFVSNDSNNNIQPNWFFLAFLSPYAGIYYWSAGDRVDTVQIQLSTNTDETINEITIYGNDDEIERMWRTLQLQEKNMIPIPSILPVS